MNLNKKNNISIMEESKEELKQPVKFYLAEFISQNKPITDDSIKDHF